MAVIVATTKERNHRPGPESAIVGSEAELAIVAAFLCGDRAERALLLTGEPGSGKTTLWAAAVAAACDRGMRVLTARPTEAEVELGYGALVDLFDGVADAELRQLPPPQREALEVALLRAAAGAEPPPCAVALALLAVLRALSAITPVLVAIDDVAALDPLSARAIAYAARRLGDSPVDFLLSRRPGDPAWIEDALGPAALLTLSLAPLSLDEARRLLEARLGFSPPRRMVRRLYRLARGNPLFVLELGRMFGEGEPAVADAELPLPPLVEELLAAGVGRLSDEAREVLQAVSAAGELHPVELAALVGHAALDDALRAGVVIAAGERLRAAHPLLGIVALRRLRTPDRRALHLALAHVVGDLQRRATQLALGTSGHDVDAAAEVATAANAAAGSGDFAAAVELAEHALRLTPATDRARASRLLSLAEKLAVAGRDQRLRELLAPQIDALPVGEARARGYLLLADGESDPADRRRLVAAAVAEAGHDQALRATVLAREAEETVGATLAGLRECEAHVAVAPADGRQPLGWCRILRGQPIDDVGAAGAAVRSRVCRSLPRLAALRSLWRGELPAARDALERLQVLADERGDDWSHAVVRVDRCDLELRAGDWCAAALLLDDWVLSSDAGSPVPQMQARCRALLAAGRGDVGQARRWAAEALTHTGGVGWDQLEARRARGVAALLAREPDRAADDLRSVWEHTSREGIDDPGAFPVAPDLVEALVELGELGEARSVATRLHELAAAQEHPWGVAGARRCAALIALATTVDPGEAAAALASAGAEYRRLGLRFDDARTLLSIGTHARRARKWGTARTALEQAASAFDALGSAGWAELARAGLARLGGRRPGDRGELTSTERRVAELAATGLTNKEVAASLFVSVSTVETHLTRIYAKLGVRSRIQLAGRLAHARDLVAP